MITKADALVQLKARLATVAATVERLVKVQLTDNVGVGSAKVAGFSTSTLLKKLNAGDYNSVPAQLARWNKNDGNVMEGLTNRRAAEAGLWAKGSFVATSTVEVQAQAPKWFTPEAVGTVLVGAGGATDNGPFQWALGIVPVIAARVVAFTFISKRLNPK